MRGAQGASCLAEPCVAWATSCARREFWLSWARRRRSGCRTGPHYHGHQPPLLTSAPAGVLPRPGAAASSPMAVMIIPGGIRAAPLRALGPANAPVGMEIGCCSTMRQMGGERQKRFGEKACMRTTAELSLRPQLPADKEITVFHAQKAPAVGVTDYADRWEGGWHLHHTLPQTCQCAAPLCMASGTHRGDAPPVDRRRRYSA